MSTSTLTSRIADAQNGVLELVTKSQKAMLDAAAQLQAVAPELPAMPELPTLPFADALGTPAEYAELTFGFAGKLLDAQRSFMMELLGTLPAATTAKTTSKKA